MLNHTLLGSALLVILFGACVPAKKYRAELSGREKCEAREQVLVREVLDRRKETADLVRQVGDLNRTIGMQDAELRDLKIELTSRTQQMGESSSKLVTEKARLERDLAGVSAQLEKRQALIQSVSSAQKSRASILATLKSTLARDYSASSGYDLEVGAEAVLLTLPDAAIFDKNGAAVSAAGVKALQALAALLSSRPELDVEVQAYTDNTVPRGLKNADDTWDWSLMRATNIVRVLIREFNVNANQLTPVGKGEFYPLASNETADGRQRNRRTVLVIYPTLPKVPEIE
ncbi:MAG: OmpA family protein [Saprospiraceae bacterium]|nr:OmpA family protein [Saprospiraceae bacterium]